jgi:hypothetical protein
MRDDRLIGLATFGVADARRVGSFFAGIPGVLCTSRGRAAGRDAVQVEFDPGRVSYANLLDRLAQLDDARPAIFWHSPEQALLAGGRFPANRAPLFYRSGESTAESFCL